MENIKKMFENIGRIYLYTENAKGDVNGIKRILSGNLHKTGGRRNPNKMWNCIFCESTRILGPNYLGFWDC